MAARAPHAYVPPSLRPGTQATATQPHNAQPRVWTTRTSAAPARQSRVPRSRASPRQANSDVLVNGPTAGPAARPRHTARWLVPGAIAAKACHTASWQTRRTRMGRSNSRPSMGQCNATYRRVSWYTNDQAWSQRCLQAAEQAQRGQTSRTAATWCGHVG